MNSHRVEIPGSAPQHAGNAQAQAVDLDQVLTASVVVRRNPAAADVETQLLAGTFSPSSRQEAEASTAADPHDLAAVEAFARQSGLQVVEADASKRIVKVSGKAADFERAFAIRLGRFGDYLSYEGPISVPESLEGVIIAVLGLDNRPVARSRMVASGA